MKNEITFIVLTYEQRLDWTLVTIHSILIQKNTNIKIIVADDGSKKNHKEEIIQYFRQNNFTNFVFLESSANHGTVSNVARCHPYCDSEYVKFISPGDNIYGEYSIRQWLDFTRDNNVDVSFCDYFTYCYDDYGMIKTTLSHQCPRCVEVYDRFQTDRIKSNMLIKNDLILGAITLGKTDVMFRYLNEIKNKLWYSEDSIYRIMAADEVRIGHFKKVALMYESYSGVSFQSTTNEALHQRQMDDWFNTTKIIASDHIKDQKFRKKFLFVSAWKRNSTVRKSNLKEKNIIYLIKEFIPLYFKVPSLLLWHASIVVRPKYVDFQFEEATVVKILTV